MIIGGVLLIIVIGAIVNDFSGANQTSQQTTQSENAPAGDSDAVEQAKQDAQAKKEADAAAAKQAAEDAATDANNAARWSITLDQAKRARLLEMDAYNDCVVTVKDAAKYDVKSDWLPNFSWTANSSTITIFGRDIHLQNGFGAYSAGYVCEWNMDSKAVTSVNANE
jgi:hypothetical protein